MAPSPLAVVRPALSLEEARENWWPLMQSLGWNRSYNDAITHYTSSGPDAWLVITPDEDTEPEGCIVPFIYEGPTTDTISPLTESTATTQNQAIRKVLDDPSLSEAKKDKRITTIRQNARSPTHRDITAHIGFFCMTEAYRGKGHGRILFSGCMGYLRSRGATTVSLDGVQEQIETYGRRGFVRTDTIKLMSRASLKSTPLKPSDKAAVGKVVSLRDIPPESLRQSDLEITGYARTKLWTEEAIFSRPDTFGCAVVSETDEQDVKGWVLVRGCQDGFRFGPLYAESVDFAELVLRSAMEKTSGEGSFVVEVWQSNADSVGLFESLGWEAVGVEYQRMWLDGRRVKEQGKGGKAERSMFAIFDAAGG